MLMGFLLLLVLSLSSLLRVEIQSASNSVENQQAELNALLGLSLAIGQLQTYAGPDQRITATADILEPGGNLANPHWVGIWATADSNSIPQSLEHYSSEGDKDTLGIEAAAKTWLVSGNNTTRTNFLPNSNIAGESVTLFGAGSTSDSDDYVEAPKVAFSNVGNSNLSKYAYWISDEGVKGSIAFERKPSGAVTVGESQNYPLKSGSAVLKLGDSTTGDSLFNGTTQSFDQLISLNQLDYLSSQNAASKGLSHDVTIRSKGVMANVRDGGLRKDLADYTQLPDGEMFDDPFDNVATPDWRQIKSFLNLKQSITQETDGSYSTDPRPYFPSNRGSDQYQQGIYPVPIRIAVYVDAAFIEKGNDRYGIHLYFFPIIALWNPYDVAIKPGKYLFTQWCGPGNEKLQFAVGRWDTSGNWEHKPMLVDDGNGNVTDDNNPRIYGINTSAISFTQRGTDVSTMRYILEDTNGIAPGETKIYTAEGLSLYQRNDRANVLKEGFRPGEGFYLSLEPPSGSSYLAPYEFEVDASDPIENWSIDLGVEFDSGTKDPDSLHEWWYMRAEDGTELMTIAGLNRAGLTYSIPTSNSSYSNNSWRIQDDGRPKAFTPTVRTATDTAPMPGGLIEGENAQNNLADFPAYGFLYELKQAYNDQNFDTQLRRRRWLANFNPRAPKSQQLKELPGVVGTINQNYIGQLRARSYDLNDNQSDLYYSPTVFGNNNERTYYGYSARGGAQRTVLYHVPRPDVPIAGVGNLMHVNFASYFTHNVGIVNPANILPAYVIGNSLADPHLFDGQLERDYQYLNFSHFDYSYKINQRLWDDYFSSTDLFDGDGPHDPRFTSYPLANTVPTYTSDDRPYTHAAAKLLQEGVFNINSTSEKAWQMLLASTYGSDVQQSDGTVKELPEQAQFLRQGLAFGDAFDTTGESEQDAYDGFRTLSAQEIILLSQRIVAEIKERGPFTSVSDFVNRSVNPRAPKEHRLMGALQAAINASNINDVFTEEITAASSDTQNDPLSSYPNPDALYGKIGTNVPGYLSQADLLNKIGNRLSARSDTFIIRAYGETSDINGNISARAYCEALLQRTPSYVNADLDDATTSPPVDSINQMMGRRFKLLSFRWINPEDV